VKPSPVGAGLVANVIGRTNLISQWQAVLLGQTIR
jgi:hypothetical protein